LVNFSRFGILYKVKSGNPVRQPALHLGKLFGGIFLSRIFHGFQTERVRGAGLPDFYRYKIPKRGKMYQKLYQMTTKLPNAHKIYPMVVKYSKRPEYLTTFSIPRPS
jgi:hypothetical protein